MNSQLESLFNEWIEELKNMSIVSTSVDHVDFVKLLAFYNVMKREENRQFRELIDKIDFKL
jgi:hypothetical protein